MQRLDLEDIDVFKETIKSDATSEQYKIHINQYLDHTPPPPSSDSKTLTNFVMKYLGAMKKRKYSRSYINISKCAIKHYYKSQDEDIVLNWSKINDLVKSQNVKKTNTIVGPTHEQLRHLFDLADITLKAIILTLASTGMRREALCQMKLSDMEYTEKYKLYKFRVYAGDEDHEYVTYCTPEAAEAIDAYKRQQKPKEYLFPGMSPMVLSVKMRQFMVKSGLGKVSHGKNKVHDKMPAVHTYRHFCITQMTKAKVDFVMRCIMTDQPGKIGVGQRYIHDMDDDLLQEYLKAIPKLTIYEKYQPPELESDKDIEIQKLKDQIEMMQKREDERIKKKKVEDEEIRELNKKVRELYDMIESA